MKHHIVLYCVMISLLTHTPLYSQKLHIIKRTIIPSVPLYKTLRLYLFKTYNKIQLSQKQVLVIVGACAIASTTFFIAQKLYYTYKQLTMIKNYFLKNIYLNTISAFKEHMHKLEHNKAIQAYRKLYKEKRDLLVASIQKKDKNTDKTITLDFCMDKLYHDTYSIHKRMNIWSKGILRQKNFTEREASIQKLKLTCMTLQKIDNTRIQKLTEHYFKTLI